jgi:OOP family OmpA-OmpF porin
MKKILFSFIILLGTSQLKAQFLEKLADKAVNAAERTVEKRVEKEAQKKTDEALDEVLEGKKGSNKKGNEKNPKSSDKEKSENNSGNKGKGQAQSAKDFVPGNKIIATEDFKQDAIGDFPVNWFTNSSGEVVTFSGDNTRWLKLSSEGAFAPMHVKRLPENFTFEFDLYCNENFSYYSTFFNLVFTQTHNKNEYAQWGPFKAGKEGIMIGLHPRDAGSSKSVGQTYFNVLSKGTKLMDNKNSQSAFTNNQNLAKVQIWRQKGRLRVYVNGDKIWDLPQAFQETTYNSIVFFVDGNNKEDVYYISNLRLAEAGGDTRHKLIETGEFSSSDILFDSGKSNLKAGSQTVLDELGNALKESTFNVLIIGHTDSDGADDANQKLSEERAKSVKNYLTTKFGINQSRIITSGKGESDPITSNSTEDGKKQNRRVEFKKL